MAILEANLSKDIILWLDNKVKDGSFKNRNEAINSIFKKEIEKELYYKLADRKLSNIWADEDDNYWKKVYNKLKG